jgi:hypothetical protein
MDGIGKSVTKTGSSAHQPTTTSAVAAARGKRRVSATKQSTAPVIRKVLTRSPPSAAARPTAPIRTATYSTRRTAGGSRK